MFAIAWLALSAAFATYLVIGIATLLWMRRRWERQTVLGVPVFVSERTGPAVVGAISPSIVMPRWALAMEPPQLALMLRHEQEHRRAGDAQLLTAAHLALTIMPWNVALWWMIARLDMAVELDCDARVLRDTDARSYGDLLLEVARPRRGPRLVGAMAFAERAGQLERRIRAIARRRDQASRGARATAALIGMAAVTVAWVAPSPSGPPRAVTPATSSRVDDNSHITTAQAQDSTRRTKPPVTSLTNARDTVLSARTSMRGDTIITAPDTRVAAITTPVPSVGASPTQQPVDSIFNRLFDGVALTASQAAQARDLIGKLAVVQAEQDRATMAVFVQSVVARMTVQARRDSALRALVANDADRALLNSRLGQFGGGRRGRSGSEAPAQGLDPLGGGRGGGGAGGGLGGGRGRVGGAGFPVLQEVPVGVALSDVIYQRLFEGIALAPEQEASARTIIADAQQAMSALISEPPMVELRMLTTGAVLMSAESRATLLGLLATDADRALVDSRIAIETRVVRRPTAGSPK